VPPEKNKQTITLTIENFVITNLDLEFLITNLTGSDQPDNDKPLLANLAEAEKKPNVNATSTNAYFSKIGEAGGEKVKIKDELLQLALYELKVSAKSNAP
jgi:hypothetical protein